MIAGIIADATHDAIRRGKLVRDMNVAALQQFADPVMMAPDKPIYSAVGALMDSSCTLGAHGSIAAIHKRLLTLWNAIIVDNSPPVEITDGPMPRRSAFTCGCGAATFYA
ncbi:hypothetical protein AXW67_07275 [Bradyrhizobium neotropicale]|uniref:Uncharacterized protein n=1 Tax=Bradyrhizobium neotropicale TaxID=1497615 RepID=A0A176ZBY9_9BRAD|nr:hypothetical protein AXW67_07275 [Bradyrhizobium neotropicale]